jgi:hypothetical protein
MLPLFICMSTNKTGGWDHAYRICYSSPRSHYALIFFGIVLYFALFYFAVRLLVLYLVRPFAWTNLFSTSPTDHNVLLYCLYVQRDGNFMKPVLVFLKKCMEETYNFYFHMYRLECNGRIRILLFVVRKFIEEIQKFYIHLIDSFYVISRLYNLSSLFLCYACNIKKWKQILIDSEGESCICVRQHVLPANNCVSHLPL